MPVVGFIDNKGTKVPFASIVKGGGDFSPLPRTFVRALANGYRASDHYGRDDVLSVTTLLNPVQQVRLMQRHKIFVQPMRNLWAMFGTLGHSILEGTVLPDDDHLIAEQRLVVERGGHLIGGTFDLIELDNGEWGGRDYKITAAYGVAKMLTDGVYKGKPDYYWQAHLYRNMIMDKTARMVVEHEDGTKTLEPWPMAGQLDITNWQIVGWSRDWRADRGQDKMTVTTYPSRKQVEIGPVEVVTVKPLIAPERVENFLKQRLLVYSASDMAEDDGLPACTEDETWNGKRCADWCDAAPRCWQYHKGNPILTRRRKGK